MTDYHIHVPSHLTPTAFRAGDTVVTDRRTATEIDAAAMFQLLRVARLTSDLHYDGSRTVTIGRIRVVFTGTDAAITFPDPFGDPANDPADLVLVLVARPFTFGAVRTVIEGLFRVMTP